MLKVLGAFHLTHMVIDLGSTIDLYKSIFDPLIIPPSFHQGENRDASFMYIGDLYVELYASRDASLPNGSSNGAKHIRRFGEGFANFGWTISDKPRDAIAFCESKGYSPVYLAGSDPNREPGAFFLHPRTTFGIMLELAQAGTHRQDPRADPAWNKRWADHPLGIQRLNCISYNVRDLRSASMLLSELADVVAFHDGRAPDDCKDSVYFWAKDHVVELMTPSKDSTELASSLVHEGPKIHSATFKVKDVGRASAYLRGLNVGTIGNPGAGTIMLNPSLLKGAKYFLTEKAVPNDPRDAGVRTGVAAETRLK
ncbi:MAG: hypothetical protein WD472_08060 [Dehalococcoidia bacterium]